MNLPRPVVVGLLIVVAAVLRVLQVEWNLVPIGALALFCGAHYRNRWLALAIPLAAMVLGDVLLSFRHHDSALYLFHATLPFVYGCYAISVAMGIGVRKYWYGIESNESNALNTAREDGARRPASRWGLATYVVPIAATTIAGSVIFYLVTNFGEWWMYDTYAKSWRGLAECYAAAVPFFERTLAGDVAGSVLLFGGSYLYELSRAADPESERI